MKRNLFFISILFLSLVFFFKVKAEESQILNNIEIKTQTEGGKAKVEIENIINGQKIDPIKIEKENGSLEVNQKIEVKNDQLQIKREIKTQENNFSPVKNQKQSFENQIKNQIREPEKNLENNFFNQENQKEKGETEKENNLFFGKEKIKSQKRENFFSQIVLKIKKFFLRIFNAF